MGLMRTIDLVETAEIKDDAVTSPKLDEAIIQYAEVEIPAAEVLKLHSEPKTLIAAPGENKFVEFISVVLSLDWNSIPYTLGAAGYMRIKYNDGAGDVVSNNQSASSFLDASENKIRNLGIARGSATMEELADTKLVLYLEDADVTGGNSPIHARVAYRIHTTGL